MPKKVDVSFKDTPITADKKELTAQYNKTYEATHKDSADDENEDNTTESTDDENEDSDDEYVNNGSIADIIVLAVDSIGALKGLKPVNEQQETNLRKHAKRFDEKYAKKLSGVVSPETELFGAVAFLSISKIKEYGINKKKHTAQDTDYKVENEGDKNAV